MDLKESLSSCVNEPPLPLAICKCESVSESSPRPWENAQEMDRLRTSSSSSPGLPFTLWSVQRLRTLWWPWFLNPKIRAEDSPQVNVLIGKIMCYSKSPLPWTIQDISSHFSRRKGWACPKIMETFWDVLNVVIRANKWRREMGEIDKNQSISNCRSNQ